MVGAVRGIDPETGHYFDDTKRYIDAAALPDAGPREDLRGQRPAGLPAPRRGPARTRTADGSAPSPRMPDWLAVRPAIPVQAARFVPPPGAVDAHCHVFGPGDEFPYAPERKYTPCDARQGAAVRAARLPRLRAQRHRAGHLPRRRQPRPGRCAARLGRPRPRRRDRPARGVTDAELADLDAAGVRGVRFNFVKRLVDPTPDDVLPATSPTRRPLGWHVVIYFEAADLAERWHLFTSPADDRGRRPHGPARRDTARRRP